MLTLGCCRRQEGGALRWSLWTTISEPKLHLHTTAIGALIASRPSGPRRGSIISYLPVRYASLLAAVIMLGTSPTVLLAGDCTGRANPRAVHDGHWYYRLDPLNHRKCWYFVTQQPSSESPAGESASTLANSGSLISIFSSLSAALQGATSARPRQDPAIVNAAPAQTGDPIAPKRSTSPPHYASRFVPNAERSARLIQLSTPSRLEHPDQQHRLDSAQREALFEEYLHWARQQEEHFP
jgi:hypothetical protein